MPNRPEQNRPVRGHFLDQEFGQFSVGWLLAMDGPQQEDCQHDRRQACQHHPETVDCSSDDGITVFLLGDFLAFVIPFLVLMIETAPFLVEGRLRVTLQRAEFLPTLCVPLDQFALDLEHFLARLSISFDYTLM